MREKFYLFIYLYTNKIKWNIDKNVHWKMDLKYTRYLFLYINSKKNESIIIFI